MLSAALQGTDLMNKAEFLKENVGLMNITL